MALVLIQQQNAPPPPAMSFTAPPPQPTVAPSQIPVTAPSVEAEFDWDGWSAAQKVDTFHKQYAQFYIPQPDEPLPTLIGSPDDLDLGQANRLHIQASRWLEHVHTLLCRKELEHTLFKGEGEWLLKTMKYKYKDKIENATKVEFERLRAVEIRAIELGGELVVLRGMKSSLDKVLATASRTITRHTKSNPGLNA